MEFFFCLSLGQVRPSVFLLVSKMYLAIKKQGKIFKLHEADKKVHDTLAPNNIWAEIWRDSCSFPAFPFLFFPSFLSIKNKTQTGQRLKTDRRWRKRSLPIKSYTICTRNKSNFFKYILVPRTTNIMSRGEWTKLQQLKDLPSWAHKYVQNHSVF